MKGAVAVSFLKRHRNDILLIAALLALSAGLWAYSLATRQAGGYAVVTIDGETVMELPLNADTSVVLGRGEHSNTLVIEDGRAYISQATCPDHICIRQGRISYDGQTIVCLPNKLVVTIRGGESPGTDAVSQ